MITLRTSQPVHGLLLHYFATEQAMLNFARKNTHVICMRVMY
jgi:hypothetical protein